MSGALDGSGWTPEDFSTPESDLNDLIRNEARPEPLHGKPPTYTAAVIFALVLFLPFGIPALFYSAKVNEHWHAGNLQQSVHASRMARNWSLASYAAFFVLSLAGLVMYLTNAAGFAQQTF